MVDRRDLFIGVTVSILTSLLGLGAYLRAWNAGEPEELVDSDGIPIEGNISERVFITVNGSRQGMFIQSRDVALPVVLFLHGGPGMPQFFLNDLYPTGLENDFTVVWWEQRGSGLSYSPDTPPQSMTVAQLISDAVTVTQYLRPRFAKEKFILLGHLRGEFSGESGRGGSARTLSCLHRHGASGLPAAIRGRGPPPLS